MTTFQKQLISEIGGFRQEALVMLNELVLPTWTGKLHGFPETLYAYMMRAFSYVDLLSSYWAGSSNAHQTKRMVDFMDRYMRYEREAHSFAVQLWRHKLMHTAKPRALKDPQSGKTMYWLLQWFEQHLPRQQHFTFSENAQQRVLNLGVVYLIEDLERAVGAYAAELEDSPDLQTNANAMEGELVSYRLRRV